jgi:hypothetical protein
MVKLDLERVGISYETAEGVADFHAAGRHTYITELLRSGVSLVEARQLARHTDVRMTMRYTHIGLEDQAQAVAKLPGLNGKRGSSSEEVGNEAQENPASEKCPRPGHAPVDAACHNGSSNGVGAVSPSAKENPCRDKGYLQKSPSDGECQKWRRRESNPRHRAWDAIPRSAKICPFLGDTSLCVMRSSQIGLLGLESGPRANTTASCRPGCANGRCEGCRRRWAAFWGRLVW